MDDLIIGLQIRPTIELTLKETNNKFKLLVENINEITNTDDSTQIGYYFPGKGFYHSYVKESKECIEYHIKLALALKEKIVKYLDNEFKQHE